MTFRELGERMSSEELTWWLAYDRIEPLPSPWLQTGITTAVIANANSTRKRFKPSDFMPVYRRKQSSDDQFNILKKIFPVR